MPRLAFLTLLLIALPMASTAQSVRRINPNTLSAPTGYTHVTVGSDGRTVHIAGQVSVDPTGQVVGTGNFGQQVTQVFENLRLALQSVGATFDDVLSTTTYVTDLSQLAAFREVRNRILRPDQLPANTLVQVVALARPEFMIEIQATAMLRTAMRD
jgi:enamine deaminase RidA (YjgF/YER057c/UK114 family)